MSGVKKAVSKVLGSTIGGGVFDVFGLKQAEQQQKAAKQQARQQEEQARQQAAQAAESAAQAQRQIQMDTERQQAQQAAQEAQQVDVATPTLELTVSTESPTQKRKRYQGQSIGGTSVGSGISLRV